jgi:hypothetical protein
MAAALALWRDAVADIPSPLRVTLLDADNADRFAFHNHQPSGFSTNFRSDAAQQIEDVSGGNAAFRQMRRIIDPGLAQQPGKMRIGHRQEVH